MRSVLTYHLKVKVTNHLKVKKQGQHGGSAHERGCCVMKEVISLYKHARPSANQIQVEQRKMVEHLWFEVLNVAWNLSGMKALNKIQS